MLVGKGVTVHSVQCLAHYGLDKFWKELAEIGRGVHLKLDQFSHLQQLLVGMGHFTRGGASELSAFEQSLPQVPRGVSRSFAALRGEKYSPPTHSREYVPVAGSQFQVLTCESAEPQDVRDFAVEQGLIATSDQFVRVVKGNLYYAHTERCEQLRPNHEVVIQDLSSDEFYSGKEARNWLGCPYGSSRDVAANPLGEGYRVWIQSKSMNRKLRPGQAVMVKMTDAIRRAMA